MRRIKSGKNEERGFVLISSYILMAGLLTAVFSYFSRSFYDFDLAQRRLSRLQALYTAESGAERALDWIKAAPPTSLQPDCGEDDPDSRTPYSNTRLGSEGTYTVRITKDCNDPNRIFWIRSTGTFDNITREVRIGVSFTNFANYALASDHMDLNTYFNGSSVWGDVHVNGPIQVYGNPVFDYDVYNYAVYEHSSRDDSRVTSSASEIYYYNNNTASDGYTPTGGEGAWTDRRGRDHTASRPMWDSEGGRPLLNQPRIIFPPADVSALKRGADTHVVNNKMWIKFNGDGTYNYSTRGPIHEYINPGSNRPMPPDGSVMYFERTANLSDQPAVVVRGIVDRDITIASPQNIGIDGNLRYLCHHYWVDGTLDNLNSCGAPDPKLTVVSAKNIVHLPEAELDPKTVYKHTASYMYGSEHEITTYAAYRVLTGAFMALGGGMTVPDPDAVEDSVIGRREARQHLDMTYLTIYGSLIEYEMKPKSALLGGYQGEYDLFSDKSGFEYVHVSRDPRLDLASLPPSMSQAMSIVSWEACDGTCG